MRCAALNSRLSGSSSHLALVGKSGRSGGGLSAGKSGVAGMRNGLVAKSWSDLSSAAINSATSPRDFGQFHFTSSALFSTSHFVTVHNFAKN